MIREPGLQFFDTFCGLLAKFAVLRDCIGSGSFWSVFSPLWYVHCEAFSDTFFQSSSNGVPLLSEFVTADRAVSHTRLYS